jgi:hypothetical protein
MTYPSGGTYPAGPSTPGLLDRGTVWSFDGWTGYEGMFPVPDDLGCLHFVTNVDGWEGAPPPRVQSDDRPSRDGTNDGKSTQPGKTVTITGIVRAPDVATLQQAMSRLSGLLCSERRYDNLVAAEAWITRRLYVRRGAETMVAPSLAVAREANFSFVLYGPEAKRFGDDITVTTRLPSATGGLAIPFTVPFSIASTIVSGFVTAINPGTMTGPVKLRIDGPITGPQVTHVGSGAQLLFASSLALASGEWLDVDMDLHRALANGQSPRNQWITSRGWSGFEKGENVWAFSAISGTGRLTVTATPAWQ